jgi:hypothetical protein
MLETTLPNFPSSSSPGKCIKNFNGIKASLESTDHHRTLLPFIRISLKC